MEPYGGFRSDVTGGGENGWKAGVRLGREGWLMGWEGDLALDFGESDATDRYQVSLDGYLEPLESRVSALFVLAGFGGTRKLGGPDSDSSILFHYRYGLGYRARFTERNGLRVDLTAIRSLAGDYSSPEASVGWVVYY